MIDISPTTRFCNLVIKEKIVYFPAPLSTKKKKKIPSSMEKDIFSKTFLFPYEKSTWFTSSIFYFIFYLVVGTTANPHGYLPTAIDFSTFKESTSITDTSPLTPFVV